MAAKDADAQEQKNQRHANERQAHDEIKFPMKRAAVVEHHPFLGIEG